MRRVVSEVMDFADVARKVINLYHQGYYDRALETVRQARPEFPDEDQFLTWFEGCLLGVSGEGERALEVLDAGLDRELPGWHPKMLLDSDLDSARTVERWTAFEARCAARVAEWSSPRPPSLIRSVHHPTGTVIALHGAGNDPQGFFEEWDAAISPDWSLVVPVGEVPIPEDRWAWPFDLSTDTLISDVEDISLEPPIIVSGFSQGGRLAAKAAWDGDIEALGLILTASGLTPDLWRDSKQVPVPVYAVVGTEDRALEGCLDAERVLREHKVPIHLDIQQGLGHQLPEDLPTVIEAGLGWLAGLPQTR